MEGIERAFSRQAAAFEDPRFNRLFTTDSEWLFERLPLSADDLVLDVAGGTGHGARSVAPQVRAVVVLDATQAMLEQGRAQGVPNVLFMRGDAAALPFVDASFDAIVCRFAIHHFDDPRRQVQEMRRCLKPHGRLALADLVAEPETRDEQDRLERLRDPSHARLPTAEELAEYAGGPVEVRDVVRELEPWLAQTETPEPAADEIRQALRAEMAGGRPTGLRPRDEAHFTHSMAVAIG